MNQSNQISNSSFTSEVNKTLDNDLLNGRFSNTENNVSSPGYLYDNYFLTNNQIIDTITLTLSIDVDIPNNSSMTAVLKEVAHLERHLKITHL